MKNTLSNKPRDNFDKLKNRYEILGHYHALYRVLLVQTCINVIVSALIIYEGGHIC